MFLYVWPRVDVYRHRRIFFHNKLGKVKTNRAETFYFIIKTAITIFLNSVSSSLKLCVLNDRYQFYSARAFRS